MNQGYSARITLEEPGQVALSHPGPTLFRVADGWRRGFGDLCRRYLSEKDATWVRSITFSQLVMPDEELEMLRRTGTIHLIAASGVHVLAVALMLQAVFAALPIPRVVQIGLLWIALGLYACAVGLQPPVVRAVIMAGLMLLAYRYRRDPDAISALSVAAVIYLVWKPETLFTIGFQLSFLAVASLALAFGSQRYRDAQSLRALVWDRARQAALASVLMALVMEPVIAYHFGWISTTSVLTNVLVIGACSILVILGIISSVTAYALPSLGIGLLALLAPPLVGWTRAVVTELSSVAGAWIHVPEFSPYWLVPYYAVGLTVWRERYVDP